MSEERQYNRKSFKAEDITRLKQLIMDGCTVLQEVEDLQQGLNETIKAIAEELELKPAQLKKAIRVAHKQSFDEEQEKMSELEDILSAAGRV